ncbi:MAG: peptidoglycan recognition protein family protein, partial [Candidatus Saccharimonadales bacterium]
MVDNLPPPNFSGPAFAERPAPAPAPPSRVAILPPRLQPSQPESPGAAVPASWIPHVPANRWYWIIVHHSATATGGAAEFDKMHRAKGWDELGYHFVIGNGSDTHDGQIEVGPRWPIQKWGAHDKTPGNEFNLHGIGICLVGNFDVTYPTHAQIRSLEKLVAYLMKTYHIPADHVLGHGETKNTDCPGRHMNVAMIRRACAQMVANTTSGYRAEIPS